MNHQDDKENQHNNTYIKTTHTFKCKGSGRKRGRKKSVEPESKAYREPDKTNLYHKFNILFTTFIGMMNYIPLFTEAFQEEHTSDLIMSIFYYIDFSNKEERETFNSYYRTYQDIFLKKNKDKIEHIIKSNKTLECIENSDKSLSLDEKIKKHIAENMKDSNISLSAQGHYVFDLSTMSKEFKNTYATFKTQKDAKEIMDYDSTIEREEVQNLLSFLNVQIGLQSIQRDYSSLISEKEEIITSLESNKTHRKLLKQVDSLVEKIEPDLNNANEFDQKAKIAQVYKDISTITKSRRERK